MKQRLQRVWELFRLDWQRIFKNRLTFLLILALMFIPSLYAWFNIAALWDPYSNTGDIKIAVYSDDKPVTVMGEEVNIGEEMISNLKDNDTLGWQFVSSKKELDKGVKKGEFYAGIYLPSDFSANLTSFVNGTIKHPEIEYSVNQKINAIAPKISDKGAGTLQETISTEFIGTVSETLLGVLNDIGFNLDSNLPSIKRVTQKILDVDSQLGTIDGYTKEVIELNKKIPSYKEKLALANEFVDLIPELDQSAQKIVTLNQQVPKIEEASQLVYQLQENIPNIKNAGRQLQMVDNDFDDLTGMMTDVITEAKNGLSIISDAQTVLPDVAKLAETSNEFIPEIQKSLEKVTQSLDTIGPGVSASLDVLKVMSQMVATATSGLADMTATPEELAVIHSTLTNVSDRLHNQSNVLTSLIETIKELQDMTGTTNLDSVVSQLEQTKAKVDALSQRVDNILTNWDSISARPDELKEALQQISADATAIGTAIASIDVESIQQDIDELIKKAQATLTAANDVTGTIVDTQLVKRLDILLTNTSKTIEQAISFLEEYQQELPALKEEIHAANTLVNGNMDMIVGGINTGVHFFDKEFPTLKKKLNQAALFVQHDLPDVENNVQETMQMVNEKAPLLEDALASAATLIQEDWPTIKDKIHHVAGLIRKGEENVDIEDVIKLLKSDAVSESSFLSEPVSLKTKDVYPVPNYGSASTPFYTALCLWVGAVLFSSVASTKFHLSEEQEKRYSKREQFLGRMGTYLVVGFFQALIVTVGNQFLLGTYTANPVWNFLFVFLIDLAFMMMVYVLVALFDNLGKGIAIIILVLSISAGGGNFPIEMSGPFFRAIHPFIPFTHAVNLLRESVGGIYWPTAMKAITILLSVTVGFFIVGYILYPKSERLFSKVSEKLKDGHILH